MEEQERSRSPSRRTSRVEQVVGRWLRRTRDSSSRERTLGDGKSGEVGSDQRNFPIRVTVQILRDPLLDSHGFTISTQPPILVQDVTAGGPAEGRLVPGDQVLKINSVAIDDLSSEQAADIIRESQDSVTMTILRHTVGPKSSFITAEKRARLRTNPVKVRFAEEVVVNGHSQGNSLLFLPNVLKVYLENGQTKAFKFEATTSVKDIVMTLKEKLSIRCIEHFALVLEQQYSITKLLLLHDEELIQQVVQRKESHDYRCLFRVCFMARDPLHMLQEDPVAFEYLYLQSVSDVLQERFAMEMKCNTALRLAALHIQERLASCGQTHKTSLKSITKNWGIENFVSPTLLRNMREKDLRKAISYHMKKTQALLEPRQKVISAAQARLNYLNQLGELKSYNGKSFSATMMLQDRESMVSLLVGAKYGVSQVINHKLNIMTTLTEFSSVSRVELLPESDKVSLVKIYLQDVKPITLMLECQAAKDLSCLVAGYCKLLVDPTLSIFSWPGSPKVHRISAEEGYVSRGCSDSEESSELDSTDMLVNLRFSSDDTRAAPEGDHQAVEQRQKNEREKGGREGEGAELQQNEPVAVGSGGREGAEGGEVVEERAEEHAGEDVLSEASDSCRTDSRFNPSLSSDSMDALEEDDLVACSSSHPYHTYLPDIHAQHKPEGYGGTCTNDTLSPRPASISNDSDPCLCFADLSRMPDCLPSPPEASEEEEEEEEAQRDVFTFEENDARHYYNICSNVTPDSARSLSQPRPCHAQEEAGPNPPQDMEPIPILQPPPGFGDSSSEDEFFDAQEMFMSPEVSVAGEDTTETGRETSGMTRTLSLSDIGVSVAERGRDEDQEGKGAGLPRHARKKSRKRRSYMETDYTSQVSFPGQGRDAADEDQLCCVDSQHPCPTVSFLISSEGEPALLESKPIFGSGCHLLDPLHHGPESQEASRSKRLSSELMEMEPDTMESKSVTELVSAALPQIMAVRCRLGPEGRESSSRQPTETESDFSDTEGKVSTDKDSVEGGRRGSTEEQQGQNSTEKSQRKLSAPCLDWGVDAEEGLVLSKVRTSPVQPSQLPLTQTAVPTISDVSSSQEDEEEGTSEKQGLEEASHSIPPGKPEGSKACLPLALKKGISLSHESLVCLRGEVASATTSSTAVIEVGATTKDTGGFKFRGCPSGIVGRLSASTLRGKIHSLPWYLYRSHEALSSYEGSTTNKSSGSRRFSDTSQGATEITEDAEDIPEVADEVTEITDELTEEDSEEVTEMATEVTEDITEVAPQVLEDVTEIITASPRTVLPSLTHDDPVVGVSPQEAVAQAGCQLSQAEAEERDLPTAVCGVFTHCESKQPQPWAHPCPEGKASFGCSSMSPLECPSLPEEAPTPMEVCGCQTVYTNCFSGALDGSSFDEELTVYEFSRRTQGMEGAPLMTTPPSSFSSSSLSSSPSSSISPFSRGVLPASSSTELSPLLSPLDPADCYPPESLEDTLNQLRNRRYGLPGGFSAIQRDVEELLALLQGRGVEPHSLRGGQHHRETCVEHFSENKRLLHAEARKLMSGCQRVTRVGQTPEETLRCLAESFRTLVQLASVCLWFSSCARCEGRHEEALGGLREVARTYMEFAQAAERAGGRKSCHDLSVKLLARQCTALTASVFCLTQLFRTLTAL
ncbi:FERM and PDZ domain-containing protein 1-like [Megalops cyprinoides]|uniref:FERM and PDZ domain-containing protein 1-like n=1 Tax=Megalops cyprinoides TaxID=118141 RepID=UPI0018646551|nr:FERM and PDZ domain-containing protein 1-like [Megalops cyprinoides]